MWVEWGYRVQLVGREGYRVRIGTPQNGAKSVHPCPGWGRMGGLPLQFLEVGVTTAGCLVMLSWKKVSLA